MFGTPGQDSCAGTETCILSCSFSLNLLLLSFCSLRVQISSLKMPKHHFCLHLQMQFPFHKDSGEIVAIVVSVVGFILFAVSLYAPSIPLSPSSLSLSLS